MKIPFTALPILAAMLVGLPSCIPSSGVSLHIAGHDAEALQTAVDLLARKERFFPVPQGRAVWHGLLEMERVSKGKKTPLTLVLAEHDTGLTLQIFRMIDRDYPEDESTAIERLIRGLMDQGFIVSDEFIVGVHLSKELLKELQTNRKT